MSGASAQQPQVNWPPAGSQQSPGAGPAETVGGTRPPAPGPQQGPAKRLCVSMKEAVPGKLSSQDEILMAIRQLYELRSMDINAWKNAAETVADHAGKLDLLMDADLQWNDRITMVGDHCAELTKNTDLRLRAHIEEFAGRGKLEQNGIESVLTATVTAANKEFEKFRIDAQTLMSQIDVRVLQIQQALEEQARAVEQLRSGPPGHETAAATGPAEQPPVRASSQSPASGHRAPFLQEGIFSPVRFNIGTPHRTDAHGEGQGRQGDLPAAGVPQQYGPQGPGAAVAPGPAEALPHGARGPVEAFPQGIRGHGHLGAGGSPAWPTAWGMCGQGAPNPGRVTSIGRVDM